MWHPLLTQMHKCRELLLILSKCICSPLAASAQTVGSNPAALILLGGLSKLFLPQGAAGKSVPGDLLTRITVWKDMDLKFSFAILS